MNFTCHKKVMDRLEYIEKKIDCVNSIYAQRYVIVNKEFMINCCKISFGLVAILAVCSLFHVI